jgi:type VII secretion EsaA-like protein
MLRKILISVGILALVAGLVASTALIDPAAAPESTAAPTIALVNEDQAGTFNGTGYLFGKEFVNLASHDTSYNWQVVSRSVAENAYTDNSVSAVIYLPQTFTHDILTLQDLDPVQAVIPYKVRHDGTDVSRQALQSKIGSILNGFNTRIVKMYFASVAGNVSQAQVAMSSVVEAQSGLMNSLSNTLYPNLGSVAKGYGSSVSLASVLQGENSAWITAQNTFTTNTQRTLTSIAGSLNSQQPQLSKYFDLQNQIAQTNTTNGNTALKNQASSDKNFFDKAFSEHTSQLISGDGTWSGLNGLSSKDAAGNPTGSLAALKNTIDGYNAQADAFNTQVNATTTGLQGQLTTLQGSVADLEALETRMLAEYFGTTTTITDANYSIDPSTLTSAEARQALAKLVATSFGGSSGASPTVQQFQQKIRTLVANIPTDPAQYTPLFTTLQSNTSFNPAQYISELELIKSYDTANGITPPALNIINPASGSADQTVTKTLPVTVPAGKKYTVGITLPATMSTKDVTLSAPTASCPAATPNCVSVAGDTATVDNTAGTTPLNLKLNYLIDFKDLSGTATVSFTAQDDATIPAPAPQSLGSDVYALVPANPTKEKIGGTEFAAITSYLGNTDTAANLLLFLFGAPADTLATFSGAVTSTGDFPGHSSESVYNRYGTIDTQSIAPSLSDTDVAAYQTLGRDNITDLVTQITALNAAIGTTTDSITKLSSLHLSDTYFSDVLNQLDTWYAAATAAITAAPADWDQKTNNTIQLKVLPWQNQAPGAPELYLDEQTGPALYSTLSQLITQTTNDASNTAGSARIITDNAAQFDTLVKSVNTTKNGTQAVLDTMQGTIGTGKGAQEASSAYSKRFSTVFANTRAPGADTNKIYDAFANPITTNDVTPSATAAKDAAFDWRWIIIFIAGTLIGILASYLAKRKRKTDTARL